MANWKRVHPLVLALVLAALLVACGDDPAGGPAGAGDTGSGPPGSDGGGIPDASAPGDSSTTDAADAGDLPDGSTADTPGTGDVTLPPADVPDGTGWGDGGWVGWDVPEHPGLECDEIPQGPFDLVKLSGPMASEDLAFDDEGNVVGSNDKAIFKSPYNGSPSVFVPNLTFRAGLRYLPNGHLVVCNNDKGQLERIDENGVQHVLLTGLAYPNGMAVDLKGWVYFTEQSANQVRRVHPLSGEWTLMTDKVKSPNGLTFSPDYRTLYIGSFCAEGATIHALTLSEHGVPGKLIKWATGVGGACHDGMATDACGNVYIADYGATHIWRVSPDGKQKKLIIDGSKISGTYLPNMQFGSGLGGWSNTKLYLPDGWKKGVFEVELGVPGAPVPFP